jgi:hypothetical protein
MLQVVVWNFILVISFGNFVNWESVFLFGAGRNGIG